MPENLPIYPSPLPIKTELPEISKYLDKYYSKEFINKLFA
tara:strand:- start:308 stop:427 length:120 start_codon:yes stop_codon:yes gene_type:complete